jgi:hypothetical protein
MDGADRFGTKTGAIIAFLHLTVFAQLRYAVRAYGQTFPATVTLFAIHQDKAILISLHDRPGGTDAHAGRLGAMHTGQRKKLPPDVREIPLPCVQHPSPEEAGFDITRTLAGRLTGTATDTPGFVINKP